MIDYVAFENFRGLKCLELSELCNITLISGKNNAGKSSVLEGIFLMLDHFSPESFAKLNRFRGLPVTTDPGIIWEPLFYGLDTKNTAKIKMNLDGTEAVLQYFRDDSFVPTDSMGLSPDILNQFITSAKLSYTLRFDFLYKDYKESGHFIASESGILRNIDKEQTSSTSVRMMPLTQYINSEVINNSYNIVEWFGKLELQGKKHQVIEILQLLEPGIRDVTTIVFRGQTQLYANIEGELLPLKLVGDGLNRLLYMVLAIIENPNSILLIDEIETGFHYSMYPKLWNVIALIAREQHCQIVATTHSYECIAAAIDSIKEAEMEDKFCYYRMELEKKENRVFRYSGNLLHSALSADMEVR